MGEKISHTFVLIGFLPIMFRVEMADFSGTHRFSIAISGKKLGEDTTVCLFWWAG